VFGNRGRDMRVGFRWAVVPDFKHRPRVGGGLSAQS
jgi:hypothetical protein